MTSQHMTPGQTFGHWFRDGYGTWHAVWPSGLQVCPLSTDRLGTRLLLPIGALTCSLCAQELFTVATQAKECTPPNTQSSDPSELPTEPSPPTPTGAAGADPA